MGVSKDWSGSTQRSDIWAEFSAKIGELTRARDLPRATRDDARPERRSPRAAGSDRGLLTGLLILPAGLWYLVLLVAPIAIVILFSFGRRGRDRRLRRRLHP